MLTVLILMASVQQKPAWMSSSLPDRVSYLPSKAYGSIEQIPAFARDMYATGVGHSLAYEALATGRANQLESRVYEGIVKVLKQPPRNPIDEEAISPVFSRRFKSLEKVFEWAHTLHFQTIDALAYPGWSDVQKAQELTRLWENYRKQPFAITGLPMNMEALDSQAYSGRFRAKYPRVNGLFWGYHWLQTVNYDMLWRVPTPDQKPQYNVIGDQYRTTELFKTDRDYMPMTAELSPRFAKAFPVIANAFDNLHMLHDNVNDILATPGLDSKQQQNLVDEAIIRVLASSHSSEKPGEAGEGIHDHRHPTSMPGMGMMKGAEADEMYMAGMGWMDMGSCAHCSMPMPTDEPWGATVTANGWTMTVRCLLCARDMAAETPGRAIIRSATEDPNRMLVMISDEEGNWTTNIPGVAFLESGENHLDCSAWSRAFTSQEALKAYVKQFEEYKEAETLDLKAWSAKNAGKPKTYQKIDKPNPYRKGGIK